MRARGVSAREVGPGVSDLKMTRRHDNFTFPFPPAEVVDFFYQYYGPTSRAFASFDKTAVRELHPELEVLSSTHNRGGHELTEVSSEYLEVIAVRE